jgi:hypothetical protein
MELFYHPGYEPLTHNVAVRAPWFYTHSAPGRLLRWLGSRLTKEPPPAPRRVTVPQISVSRIMDEHGLDVVNYLKLDCEGSEFEIMRALRPEHWSRIERVAMEYHEYGRDRRVGELVEILRDNGFEVDVYQPRLDRMYTYVGARFGALWARRPALAA